MQRKSIKLNSQIFKNRRLVEAAETRRRREESEEMKKEFNTWVRMKVRSDWR